jgi:hypothetical protein
MEYVELSEERAGLIETGRAWKSFTETLTKYNEILAIPDAVRVHWWRRTLNVIVTDGYRDRYRLQQPDSS